MRGRFDPLVPCRTVGCKALVDAAVNKGQCRDCRVEASKDKARG
jgi:hypothetical protein